MKAFCPETQSVSAFTGPFSPARFEGIEDLPKRVQVMPASAEQVKAYIAAHCPT